MQDQHSTNECISVLLVGNDKKIRDFRSFLEPSKSIKPNEIFNYNNMNFLIASEGNANTKPEVMSDFCKNTSPALSNFSEEDVQKLKELIGNDFPKIQGVEPRRYDRWNLQFTNQEILDIKKKLEQFNDDCAKILSAKLLNNKTDIFVLINATPDLINEINTNKLSHQTVIEFNLQLERASVRGFFREIAFMRKPPIFQADEKPTLSNNFQGTFFERISPDIYPCVNSYLPPNDTIKINKMQDIYTYSHPGWTADEIKAAIEKAPLREFHQLQPGELFELEGKLLQELQQLPLGHEHKAIQKLHQVYSYMFPGLDLKIPEDLHRRYSRAFPEHAPKSREELRPLLVPEAELNPEPEEYEEYIPIPCTLM